MKTLTLIFALAASTLSFGQRISDATISHFWEENATAIILLDEQTLVENTHFPLGGDWGYIAELDKAEEEWTSEDFKNNLYTLFPEMLRAELKLKSYHDAVEGEFEDGTPSLSIIYTTIYEEDGEEFESSIFYVYKEINGKWMLFEIVAAG